MQQNATGPRGAPSPGGSFFASISNSGWFRAQPRWIAGVCSGISVRTGWDVRLVRGLVIVVTLISWVPVILYGAAWLLLPNGPRGPIEAKLALEGRFDWSQLWAGLMVVLGILALPGAAVLGLSMVALWWVAVLGSVIALIVYFSSNHGQAPVAGGAERGMPMSTPNQNPQTPRGPYSAPAAQAGGTPPPPQRPYPQVPYYAPQPPTRPPAISNLVGFLTVGALFLIAAAGLLPMFQGGEGSARVVLITIGLIVLITGGVLVWAALTGRRGGWFLGFSIAGALLVLPATAIGMGVAGNLTYWAGEEPGAYVEALGEIDVEASGTAVASEVLGGRAWFAEETGDVMAVDSRVVWDLTDPSAGGAESYFLQAYESEVTILVSSEQLPALESWTKDGYAAFSVDVRDPSVKEQFAQDWVDAVFAEGTGPGAAQGQPSLQIHTQDSQVAFMFLNEEQIELISSRADLYPAESPWAVLEELGREPEPVQPAQSGAETPQSGN